MHPTLEQKYLGYLKKLLLQVNNFVFTCGKIRRAKLYFN